MLTPLSILVLIVSLLFTALYHPQQSNNVFTKQKYSRNVLLLTAHPDDECLFFAPTILALTGSDDRNKLYSFTLSNGDAEGLGETRKRELEGSLDVLGVGPEHRRLVNHPQLRDNMTVYWSSDVIADLIRPYVVEHNITTILTFDHEGISSHPNHKSIPDGVKRLIQTYSLDAPSTPRLYSLITVPLLTKYNGVLSPILAKIDLLCNRGVYYLELAFVRVLQMLGVPLTSEPGKSNYAAPATTPHFIMPVFVSGIKDYWRAISAMREHRSQLLWFRYLYVLFSRYMWVNEWVEIKVVHS
ncbi:hypothetical protein AMATHDRAFT_86365 [Amanita thiersii Skay4041]|uniref:N-acetylglucosaminylphosphatidylinositol deacetylase n=1 Tax=Amanita thiersii Skay4041 TaxID=703135 RepID=A0A2A9NG35_9AGAR|nr:hypothetical protein AMATHDRAFT_86365 [Amanita thiersii Skay4041]